MKVTDNFLPSEDFKAIQSLILSDIFTWNFSVVDIRSDEINDFHFSHVFTPEDQFFKATFPFIDIIKPQKIIKVKANLQPRTEKNIVQSFHTDFPPEWNHKTGIFYVNTCDGYTLFSDGTKVESVENRFVEFDGCEEHTGVTCTDQPGRFVINFNWYES